MKDLIDTWVNNTEEAIRNIQNTLSSDKEYDSDFVKLARFIAETDINPWQFMPTRWESVHNSAQMFESFLCQLHHAMVDDGDVCFINVEVHGPHIEFIDKWDEDRVLESVKKRFSQLIGWAGIPKYTVHSDSNLFIEQLITFEKAHIERIEKLEKNRTKAYEQFQ